MRAFSTPFFTAFLQILFDDGVARFRCADQWIAVQREKRIATPIRENVWDWTLNRAFSAASYG